MGRVAGKKQAKRGAGPNKRPDRVCELCKPKDVKLTNMWGRHLKNEHEDKVFGTFTREGHRTIEAVNDIHRLAAIAALKEKGVAKPNKKEIRAHLCPPEVAVDNTDYKELYIKTKRKANADKKRLISFF